MYKIFKFLQKCNRNNHVTDVHGFKAQINDGVVWVECRGYEVYVETQIFDRYTNVCKKSQWVGTVVAAANRLEQLGMDFYTIDM